MTNPKSYSTTGDYLNFLNNSTTVPNANVNNTEISNTPPVITNVLPSEVQVCYENRPELIKKDNETTLVKIK
jgi:hypothetical protein